MEFNYIEDFFSADIPNSPFKDFCLDILPDLPESGTQSIIEVQANTKRKNLVTGCNCTKTKCLKMYCECFSNGLYCLKDCKCRSCNNSERFESRHKAVANILEKNPQAFEHSRLTGTRGCSCRRSGCQKKYCECFLNGIGCSALCRCESCRNMNSHN